MKIATTIEVRTPKSWLSKTVAALRRLISFRTTLAERRIYRKRKKIPVSVWASRHRIVTRGPLEGTRYKNSTTPYLPGIMDASFFPSVETIIICAALQVGKSFCVDTCIGYATDIEPGPVLYVYPDEETAVENSKDRILPMIQQSSRLRQYLTGSADDEAAKRINLQHMQIYMAWARSAVKLANKSIRHLVLDEIDKYPETAGKRETDPISLAEGRTRTYRFNRKIWKASTPTVESGPIWKALTTEAQVIFDYWVRCPFCKTYQIMDFEHIKWPADVRDPVKVKAEELAWYECKTCAAHWNDYDRDRAVRLGQWRSRRKNGTQMNTEKADQNKNKKDLKSLNENICVDLCESVSSSVGGQKLMAYLKEHRPRNIGFHLPSWISHFVSLSEPAASFLTYVQTGDLNDFKDFQNKHKAEPWRIQFQERKEDRITALCDERPSGIVPSGGVVAALVAGVDTQDNGFYYRVRAFGFGMEQESWGVRFGFVDSFEALRQVLFEEAYVDVEGQKYVITLALQDAMGHKTAEVYDFVRPWQGRIFAAQGVDRRTMTTMVNWSTLEFYPGTKKPIRGGIRLLRHNANLWKNTLAHKLEIKPGDPGAFHVERDSDVLEYARQMCAEVLNENEQWICQAQRANHYWDCEVLCLVAADVLRLKYKARSKAETKRTASEQKESKRVPLW
jgi:phage terminase large subunit GpA-like protein